MAASDAASASDRAFGIVWAYLFHEDGSAEPIADAELNEAVAAHRGWIWIHLSRADMRAHEWINRHAPISPDARDVLLGRDEHQRLDIAGNEIMGVLVDIQMEFARDSQETARLRFVITDRLLISVRRRPLRSVELTRQSLEMGQKFPAAISVLDTIIDHFADAIGRWAEHTSDELDLVEDRVLQDEVRDERQRLGQVRRQIVPMHRQLAQLRALFHRLEPRCVGREQTLSTTIRALTQKLEFTRSRGALDSGAFPVPARRDRRQDDGGDQSPLVHPVDADRLPAAADAGDRDLRDEHQGSPPSAD